MEDCYLRWWCEEFVLIAEIGKGRERKGSVYVEAEKFLPSTLLLPPLTPGNQRVRVRESFTENQRGKKRKEKKTEKNE